MFGTTGILQTGQSIFLFFLHVIFKNCTRVKPVGNPVERRDINFRFCDRWFHGAVSFPRERKGHRSSFTVLPLSFKVPRVRISLLGLDKSQPVQRKSVIYISTPTSSGLPKVKLSMFYIHPPWPRWRPNFDSFSSWIQLKYSIFKELNK